MKRLNKYFEIRMTWADKDLGRKTYREKGVSYKFILIVLCLSLFATSCHVVQKKYFDEGYIEDGKYINETIGWSMDIPKSWEKAFKVYTTEKEEIATSTYEAAGIEIKDDNSSVWMIHLQKDRFNQFISFYEKGPDINQQNLINYISLHQETFLLFFPYQVEVIYISPLTKEKINGCDFFMFSYELFLPSPLNIKLNGDNYMGIVNHSCIGVTISYTDKHNKEEIRSAWLNSKFRDVTTERIN